MPGALLLLWASTYLTTFRPFPSEVASSVPLGDSYTPPRTLMSQQDVAKLFPVCLMRPSFLAIDEKSSSYGCGLPLSNLKAVFAFNKPLKTHYSPAQKQ